MEAASCDYGKMVISLSPKGSGKVIIVSDFLTLGSRLVAP